MDARAARLQARQGAGRRDARVVLAGSRAQVKTATVLARLLRDLGPPPGGVGLHLDDQHNADRDEYKMLVWGAFARPVLP